MFADKHCLPNDEVFTVKHIKQFTPMFIGKHQKISQYTSLI